MSIITYLQCILINFCPYCDTNRWFSLEKGAASTDGSLQGVAQAYLSSAVSGTGDIADIGVYFFLGDSKEKEQIFLDTLLTWGSPKSWFSAGNIDVNTVMRIVDGMFENSDDDDSAAGFLLDRDFALAFSYLDGVYDYGSVLKTSEMVETNVVEASGGYGGDFAHW